MIFAGNQSYFFPYIGYFQLINAVDKFNLNDNFNFIAKGWVNRNNILVKGRGSFMITLPLVNRSSYINIRDLMIDDFGGTKRWRRKICKTVYDNYRHAPMFRKVYSFIESMIFYPTQYLSELNINSITSICKYLNINTLIEGDQNIYQHIEKLIIDEKYSKEKYPGLDHREIRLIEICMYEGADTLLNSIGGMNLYKKETFEKYNIRLKFLRSNPINYRQYNDLFIPNLSIIDVLMYNETERISEMLNDYMIV